MSLTPDYSMQINTVFNYVCCVTTNPGSHDSPLYHRLCREAKEMGTLAYDGDGSDEDMEEGREGVEQEEDAEEQLLPGDTGATKRKDIANPSQNNTPANVAPKHWTQLSANEWTTCRNTGVLKPPRAHYDHVTKRLVMNMDHYCPWMANTVGYGKSPCGPIAPHTPPSACLTTRLQKGTIATSSTFYSTCG
jgi:palmitoyltransferase